MVRVFPQSKCNIKVSHLITEGRKKEKTRFFMSKCVCMDFNRWNVKACSSSDGTECGFSLSFIPAHHSLQLERVNYSQEGCHRDTAYFSSLTQYTWESLKAQRDLDRESDSESHTVLKMLLIYL